MALGTDEERSDARDLVIRILEYRQYFRDYEPALDDIVRAAGLYPYASDPDITAASDALAIEAHRPDGFPDREVVFHEVQAEIYLRLLSGENVVLSAPTSFGKSLIIDALVGSGRYDNVVVVVPTLALIEETRRRLAGFSATHHIISHPSQVPGPRNVFVLTQERLLDFESLPTPDIFVVDEFYKLDRRADADRAVLLNMAFYRLWKTGAQFYMLGPGIEGLAQGIAGRLNCSFFHTDYATVASETVQLRVTEVEKRQALVSLLADLEGPTLVYCRSPKRVRDVAEWLVESSLFPKRSGLLSSVGAWIAEDYHPEWIVGESLQRGIGQHHGRLPRALAQHTVRLFNDGTLNILLCTSTLIEGVNTAARNVVVLDRTLGRRRFDFFTFNNIRGRSGRMFRHFIGKVFLFDPPPEAHQPEIEFPVVSQPEDVTDALVLEIDREDLRGAWLSRREALEAESPIDMEIIRESPGVEPEAQMALARELIRDGEKLHETIAWRGSPDFNELAASSELAWKHFLGNSQRRWGVSSGRQLAYRILQLQRSTPFGDRLRGQMERDATGGPTEAIEGALEFVRQWPGHYFGLYLGTLDRIQREVFQKLGLSSGDYRPFIARTQGLFLPGPLALLEEYGIPVQTAERLVRWLPVTEGLDEVLRALRVLSLPKPGLMAFEVEMVRSAREGF